jgi:hypothetical protein
MIERFNFYDVYGYLLPGLALLGLAWLPFAILRHKWPENELLSAVVVLAIGYVLGHLLQNVATVAFPSSFPDAQGRRRYPSDQLLDKTNTVFNDDAKRRIRERAQQQYSIDVSNGEDGNEDVSRCRSHAFLMARQALIRDKVAGYAEQFEGLYSMMRGLAVSTLLGFFYLCSWAVAFFKSRCALYVAAVLLVLCLVTIGITGVLRIVRRIQGPTLRRMEKTTIAGFAVGVASAAYLLGFDRVMDVSSSKIFLLLGIICLAASLRFWVGYKNFAFEFATTIWRYYAYQSGGAVSKSDT